jgi:hypothetical protein
MAANHIRNTIALLLILTLANLGASFATLYAAHVIRERPAQVAQQAR